MQIKPLSFFHQDLLESRFRQMNLPISEYSFANLYLFRQLHHYEVIELEEEIFIKGITRDKLPFIMLTCHPQQISHALFQKIQDLTQVLFPIPEEWTSSLESKLVQASFKEEDSDYLYTRVKLATYRGRHLDGKRNQVKQLFNHHKVKSEALSNQFKDAEQILEHWALEHAKDKSSSDYYSCLEAIHNFDRLRLSGRIIYVDQQPTAFIIGEKINQDCYTAHFSKASRSIKGVYQYLFQDLAQSLDETYSWINLEQDLGIPELRYSKLSYHPDLLLKKWRVELSYDS